MTERKAITRAELAEVEAGLRRPLRQAQSTNWKVRGWQLRRSLPVGPLMLTTCSGRNPPGNLDLYDPLTMQHSIAVVGRAPVRASES
jgi:hypothetical protein